MRFFSAHPERSSSRVGYLFPSVMHRFSKVHQMELIGFSSESPWTPPRYVDKDYYV